MNFPIVEWKSILCFFPSRTIFWSPFSFLFVLSYHCPGVFQHDTTRWKTARGRHFLPFWNQIPGRAFGCPDWNRDGVTGNPPRPRIAPPVEIRSNCGWRGGLSLGFMVDSAGDENPPREGGAAVQDSANVSGISDGKDAPKQR